MDVVPKRLWTALTLLLITAVSLTMLFGGSLDGAAAWANIIALPVSIVGVILTLRGSGRWPNMNTQDQGVSGTDRPVLSEGAGNVTQIGFAQRDQINVRGDYYSRNSDIG